MTSKQWDNIMSGKRKHELKPVKIKNLIKADSRIIEKLALLMNSHWSIDLGTNRLERFTKLAAVIINEGYRKVSSPTVSKTPIGVNKLPKLPKTWGLVNGEKF